MDIVSFREGCWSILIVRSAAETVGEVIAGRGGGYEAVSSSGDNNSVLECAGVWVRETALLLSVTLGFSRFDLEFQSVVLSLTFVAVSAPEVKEYVGGATDRDEAKSDEFPGACMSVVVMCFELEATGFGLGLELEEDEERFSGSIMEGWKERANLYEGNVYIYSANERSNTDSNLLKNRSPPINGCEAAHSAWQYSVLRLKF